MPESKGVKKTTKDSTRTQRDETVNHRGERQALGEARPKVGKSEKSGKGKSEAQHFALTDDEAMDPAELRRVAGRPHFARGRASPSSMEPVA